MKNYMEVGFDGPVWGGLVRSSIEWVWEQLKPWEDPESFYFLCSKGMGPKSGVGPDLTRYKRSVHFIDDPGDRANPERFVNPHRQVIVWPGLDKPLNRVSKGRELIHGGHFWEAVRMEVPERSRNAEYDVLISGIKKIDRKKRLTHLCAGTDVLCLGYDWNEHFPVKRAIHRKEFGGEMLRAANYASSLSAVELIYHSPSVKSFMSVRLPNCLKRGSVPAVDLFHDPNRLMLLTEKFRENLYVDSPEDLKRAADFSRSEITREDIQQEYDEQVKRAVSDMSNIRKTLQETL